MRAWKNVFASVMIASALFACGGGSDEPTTNEAVEQNDSALSVCLPRQCTGSRTCPTHYVAKCLPPSCTWQCVKQDL